MKPLPGEAVLGSWVAALPIGSWDLSLLGGTLVLTNRRLVFVPIMRPLLGSFEHAFDHDEIRSAYAMGDLRLRLFKASGGHRDYLVINTRWSNVWDTENTAARDDAVARINAAFSRDSA